MNGFVLFMMFFVSPPAAKAQPVWTLHSTTQFQFASKEACQKFGEHLQDQLDTTDTMKMRGWCVSVATGAGTYGVSPPTDLDKRDLPGASKPPEAGQQSQDKNDIYLEIRSKRARPKQR